MREIKFRAWIADERQMYKADELSSIDAGHHGVSYYRKESDGSLGYMTHHSGTDAKIMQYTGLKDKNCVEIYEGDVLRYVPLPEQDDGSGGTDTYEVVWKDFGFTARWLQACDDRAQWIENALHGVAEDMEVIGNAYENAGLLAGASST